MKGSSRFGCPSSSLGLNMLLKHARYVLGIMLSVAIVLHGFLILWRGPGEQAKTVRPLTTRFVKRQPRLTKPLEMKKRPRPKRRFLQRRMVTVKAKVDRRGLSSAVRPVDMVRRLSQPKTGLVRNIGFAQTTLEPEAVAQVIEGTKESKHVVDMSLEMLDIDALDTGKYQAMIIQDPEDKRNVKGYFRLAVAYSVTLQRTEHNNDRARWSNAIWRLAEAMNRWTDVKCKVTDHIPWTSQRLLETPWVYTAVRFAFEITEAEALYLGKYLMVGGFLMTDAQTADRERARNALRSMVIDALETQGLAVGTDYNFDILPNSHPLYHCFFDFDGPPMGTDFLAATRAPGKRLTPHPYLRGVHLDGRMVVLECDKNYRNCWSDWGAGGLYTGYEHLDPTRAFQFGVNILIFALTQEGSITNQVMDSVE